MRSILAPSAVPVDRPPGQRVGEDDELPAMKQYRTYSYWLDSCGDDLSPRSPLLGPTTADVAILGAGFTGLWTAYYLLRRAPSLRVVVLEREIAGFGASGRNGGWCTANFVLGPEALYQRYGPERAGAIQAAMIDTVDEVGRVAAAESIEADYRKGGELLLALGQQHVPKLEATKKAYERIGHAQYAELLDAPAVARRLRVTGAQAGLAMPACAVVHPGKLVRGLARAVERLGGIIHEQTPVTSYHLGSAPILRCESGFMRAKTVVLAGEAYLTQLRPLHRQAVPLYSLIVLTAPLSQEQWEAIGWQGNECVASARYTVDYLSRTADGRILFGGRGAPYHFGSRIDDSFDQHGPTHAMLRRMVSQWFPALEGVQFTHAWGGPLGVARDWTPTVSYDRARGVATARSYIGQGVATTNLAGRILADLITDQPSPESQLAFVGHRSPDWEVEPLRWLGVRYVQGGLQAVDRRAEQSGRPPSRRSMAERLAGH
jgi:glycine/D-amino acid oxidase-like deaminating enzyme